MFQPCTKHYKYKLPFYVKFNKIEQTLKNDVFNYSLIKDIDNIKPLQNKNLFKI